MIERPPVTPTVGPTEEMVGTEINRIMTADTVAIEGLQRAVLDRNLLGDEEALKAAQTSDNTIRYAPVGAETVRSFSSNAEDEADFLPVTRKERAANQLRNSQAKKIELLELDLSLVHAPYMIEDPDFIAPAGELPIEAMSFPNETARRAEESRRKTRKKDAPMIVDPKFGTQEHLDEIENSGRSRAWKKHQRKQIELAHELEGKIEKLRGKMHRGEAGDTHDGRKRSANISELQASVSEKRREIDNFDQTEYEGVLKDEVGAERARYGNLHGLELERDSEKREKLFRTNGNLRRDFANETSRIDSLIADIDAVDRTALSDDDIIELNSQRDQLVTERLNAESTFKQRVIDARTASRAEVARYDDRIARQRDAIADADAVSAARVRNAQETLGSRWVDDLERSGEAELRRNRVYEKTKTDISEVFSDETYIKHKAKEWQEDKLINKAWEEIDATLKRTDDESDLAADTLKNQKVHHLENRWNEVITDINETAQAEIGQLEANLQELLDVPMHTLSPDQRTTQQGLIDDARARLASESARIMAEAARDTRDARTSYSLERKKFETAFDTLRAWHDRHTK